MNVYWGYDNGGKLHIEFYGMYNGMTMLRSIHNYFEKSKYKILHRGVSPNNKLWINHDFERIMYYRKDDKLLSLVSLFNDDFRRLLFVPTDAYINSRFCYNDKENNLGIDTKTIYNKTMKEVLGKRKFSKNIKKFMSDVDIQKYLSDEYKGTNIHNRAIQNFMYRVGESFQPLGCKMLNDNADEIFDDVDMILTSTIHNFALPKPHGYEYGTGVLENHYLLQQKVDNTYEIPPNVLNKLRNANNVIPYKSNIFDAVVKHIDSFSHFTNHKYVETPVELFKKDKKLIWDYLDHQLNLPLEVAEFLTKNNIPYNYFDLDNDSYNEVFGGNYEIDREYTSHAYSWEGYEDRYKEVARIADEYVFLRSLNTIYTPPKL